VRVLVTGGAGYIGSISTRVLLDAGHDVVVLDSLERGNAAAVDGRARLVRAGVDDARALDEVLPLADAVLHCAGYIDVAESQADPDLYYRKNLSAPSVMLDRMMTHGVRYLVFSSTAAVYGEPANVPIPETARCFPVNVYGASKLAFERMIEAAEHAGALSAVRLRYFNVAGAWPDGSLGEAHDPETHIVPRILRSAAEGARFTLFGDDYPTPDGTCIRDYVHVADLAEAHRLALEWLASNDGGLVCNLGSGRGYSNLEIVRACESVTGSRIAFDVAPRRAGDPARLVASIGKAEEVLGWSPERDLDSMVADARTWHAAHPNGYRAAG
jgi:UDP-glucose 4-epimerase